MRVKNSTLRMYSALGGLVVVAIIALVTFLGHHSTPPPPSYNLSNPQANANTGGLSTIGPTSTPAPAPSVVSLGMFNMGGVGSSSPTCETWPASTGNGITAQIDLQLADPSAAPVTIHSITVQWTDLSGNVVATTTDPIPAGQSATVTSGQAASFSVTAPSNVTLDFYGSDNYGCAVTGVS